MINNSELRRFLQDFADNIQRDYPVPGVVPRHASQFTIDIFSYTRWTVTIHEGPVPDRLPTAVALTALDELGRQLGQHGPSEMIRAIKTLDAILPWAYGSIVIKRIAGLALNESLSNEDSVFQTA